VHFPGSATVHSRLLSQRTLPGHLAATATERKRPSTPTSWPSLCAFRGGESGSAERQLWRVPYRHLVDRFGDGRPPPASLDHRQIGSHSTWAPNVAPGATFGAAMSGRALCRLRALACALHPTDHLT
jgi:hypothetical protein